MIPVFCPNPHCSHHHDNGAEYRGHWKRAGFYQTLVVGPVRRFSCTACGRGFSERTFSLDYYTKRRLDFKEIHRAISQSESRSSIARHLDCSSDSIQNRIDRLARNSLVLHERLLGSIRLSEHLVADGFESFDRSQFFPNQINLLVGKQSQFLYGVTHATIRRKGAMTVAQKRTKAWIETSFRPPPNAVECSFARLLEIVPALWVPATMRLLTLWTDEHRAYPRSIDRIPTLKGAMLDGAFSHRTVSSKRARTVANPLFAVNYYDRELRKDLAALRRESTCFTRNVANGLARLVLHLVYHNYQKPHRVKICQTSWKVHAEVAGISADRIAECFAWLYRSRAFLTREHVSNYNKMIWLKETITPLKKGRDYLPRFARA